MRTFNLFSAKSIFCSVVFFFNLVKRDRASVFDVLEFSSFKAGPAITASNSQKSCRRRSNCERSVLGGIEPSINASYVQRSIVYRSQLEGIRLFLRSKLRNSLSFRDKKPTKSFFSQASFITKARGGRPRRVFGWKVRPRCQTVARWKQDGLRARPAGCGGFSVPTPPEI